MAPWLIAALLATEKPQWLERPPQKLVHVEPVYPPAAAVAEREATVDLVVTIDRDGRVVTARASGLTEFFSAAEAAVRQWVFAAEPPSGLAQRSFLVTVTFRLAGKRVHHAPIEELVAQLVGEDLQAAGDAGVELSERGQSSVPHVLPLVSGQDGRTRERAFSVLAELGPAAAVAAPALAREVFNPLNRGDKPLLWSAVHTLIQVDPATAAATLLQAVTNRDESACLELARGLGLAPLPRQPEREAALVSALELPGCRESALNSIRAVDLSLSVDVLAPSLCDERASVRRAALSAALGGPRLAERRARVTPALLQHVARLLDDPDRGVRSLSIEALELAQTRAAAFVPSLARLLSDEDGHIRLAAARALEHLGLAAREAGPALLGALRNASPNERAGLVAAATAVEAGKTDEQLAQEPLLRELAAREWCRRGRGTAYFAFKGADASAEVLERLRAAGCAAQPGSAAPRGRQGISGGYHVSIGSVAWMAGDLAHVELRAWCGVLCAEYGYYVLALIEGRWTVLRLEITLVSDVPSLASPSRTWSCLEVGPRTDPEETPGHQRDRRA